MMKIMNLSGKTLVLVLMLTMSACFEIETFTSNTGDVVFKGFGIELFQTGGANDRVLAESTWKHVYKNSAKIEIENKVNGQKYSLDYNPNNFTQAYKITLPFGNYVFSSVVEGGEFEPFLPFEASGEFTLSSGSMDIILQASTDYGLVTVKNQYVSSSVVSTGGKTPVNLALLGDDSYRFIYAKGGTPTKLEITESYSGTTIERNLNIVKYRHYNFLLELSEGNVNFIDLVMGAFEYEEEVIQLVSGKFSDANGTIKCQDAEPGDKGMVNGKLYEAVDRALLIQRRDEGADLTCVCTSLVTDMSNMFREKDFNQPIGNWDVSNVTNMFGMFVYSTFNQPIGNWDVSNVTNMSNMFSSKRKKESSFNQPIDNWDVSSVTDMSEMFRDSGFNQPIGNWDVSNVTNMSGMFSIFSLFNQPIGNWNVSNVTNMSSMFLVSVFNQPIGNWDVSNVTDMTSMLSHSKFDQPIENWNVSNVTNMGNMFYNNSSFNQPIGNWDVGNVSTMQYMFANTPFNQPIGNWDVSNVSDMSWMFSDSFFNQAISNWDVGNVTNMARMFDMSLFNQPIGNWDVSNVTDMSGMFNSSQFNQAIGNWDVSNVTDMSWLFSDSFFNQPIGNWDVASVVNMGVMFAGAESFNQPIGNWNVGNVTNMARMFSDTPFNQDIAKWCVSNILTEPDSFSVNSPLLPGNKPDWGTCPG